MSKRSGPSSMTAHRNCSSAGDYMDTKVVHYERNVARRTRLLSNPVPFEGENGLFSESWCPICLSTDIPKGGVVGVPFLDGRVVAFRGEDGIARVMSAYCPHMGADLSMGKVVGNNIQCKFHKWEMNGEGWCVKTGVGDPAPRKAC